MANTQFEVAKGNRDWYGVDAVLRNRVSGILREVFERYGYDPIETPVLETRNALAFKGGGEIQKEVFQLRDQGGRDLALRFDQTVPLARFVASHQDIKFPFKRYVIGPVFRDGPTQPEQGRFRQFTQCDVDVLGIKQMAAEAELFALAQDAFGALGLGGVDVKINNRKLLDGVLDYAGVPDHAKLRTIVTLDKMDKIGLEGVRASLNELTLSDREMSLDNNTLNEFFAVYDSRGSVAALNEMKGKIIAEVGEPGFREVERMAGNIGNRSDLFSKVADYRTMGNKLLTGDNVQRVMDITQYSGDNEEVYRKLEGAVNSEKGREGLSEVRQLLDYSKSMNLDFIRLDPSLARGLDYYTGTTIEVYLKDRNIVNSAILAGGRFDDMVGDFRGGDEEIPAVGFSFGLERLVMILADKEKNNVRPTNTQIYLIPVGNSTDQCLRVAHDLRKLGVKVDMELQGSKKVKRSIGYADSKGIRYVGFVGEDEIRDGAVALKNLKTGEQSSVKVEDVYNHVRD